jgi:hypothetical protein
MARNALRYGLDYMTRSSHVTAFGALYEIDKVLEAIIALKEICRLVPAEKRMRR